MFATNYNQGRCLISSPSRWGCWWVTVPAWSLSNPNPSCRAEGELSSALNTGTVLQPALGLCQYTKPMGLNSAICSPDLIESVGITWNYLITCRLTNNSRHCSQGWAGAWPFLSLPEEWGLCPANNNHYKFLLLRHKLGFFFLILVWRRKHPNCR